MALFVTLFVMFTDTEDAQYRPINNNHDFYVAKKEKDLRMVK